MPSRSDVYRRFAFLLGRFKLYLLLLVLAGGFAVAAIERWRPGLIDSQRHFIFVALDAYFHPTRELVLASQKFAARVERLWGIEENYEKTNQKLTLALAELQSTREQMRRLGRISGLRQWESPAELEFVLADVTGFSSQDRSAELLINRGRLDHLEPGLPVVGQKGLVGVIREVTDRSARVQALADPLSAVGVAETESRARGIVMGHGRDEPVQFVPENETQPVREGTVLITSGFKNSVYPKGLIVGKIRGQRSNDRDVEYGVVVPAENLNALEEVLVIRRTNPATSGSEKGLGSFTLDMPTTGTLANDPATPMPLSDAGRAEEERSGSK